MKFVFFGYDFSLNILDTLLESGHTCAGIFTFTGDDVFNTNLAIQNRADTLNIPFITEPVTPQHIAQCLEQGTHAFIAAGYPHKIPPIDANRAYGMNLHPSLLPQGRGLMPTPHIILSHPEAAGMTVHKLSPRFDQGDIIAQKPLEISGRETVETYAARVALHAPALLRDIMSDIKTFWAAAKPQDETKAVYFPKPDESMRRLDWSAGTDEIDRKSRAFGRFGCIGRFDETLWIIYHLDAWQEKHTIPPGTVVHRTQQTAVIATRDGFTCLKDVQRIG